MSSEEGGETHLGRILWRCSLLGLLVGLVVGGGGSRLAMRIVALVNDEFTGTRTDAGERVGQITAGGTLFLLFLGSFVGTFGGAAYALLRAWLPRRTLLRGLVFGLGLLALTAFPEALVDSGGVDFEFFQPVELSIAMFAALPLLYGVALSALADRLAPGELGPLSRPVALGGGVAIAVFIAAGLAKLVATVAEIV